MIERDSVAGPSAIPSPRTATWVEGASSAESVSLGNTGSTPYRVHHPSVGLAGATPTPSTVEVYVNDRLVRRDHVPAGEFELQGLPVTAGRGDARVVLRDAFGRVQEIGTPYYMTPSSLQRGLHEYGYHVGTQRNQVGTHSWAYGGPVFLGRHRYGVTDWLTVGGRVETTGGLVSGGPRLTGRTPFGEVTAAGAASHDTGQSGWAGALGYGYTSRGSNVSIGVRVVSDRYATISLRPGQDRTATESNLSVAFQLPRATSVALRHTVATASSGIPDKRVSSATINTRLSRSSMAAVSVDRVGRDGRFGWDLSTSLILSIAGDRSASMSVGRVEDDTSAGFEFQRSAPVGTGYGYRLQAQESQRGGSIDGFGEYQGPVGRYEFRQASLDGSNAASVRASGSLVMIGGGLHAARPVRDGYALIRVPGVEGVRAYASNQEIDRTNDNGDVLVPNLLSSYANRLRIEDQDVPFDYALGSLRRTVAPPYRGGAVVEFPVRARRSAVGSVQLTDTVEGTIPTYGELRTVVDDQPMASPTGANGEFYFEFLPPGRHAASVAYLGRTCDLTLDVPERELPMTDIGLVTCRIGGEYASPSLHVDAHSRDEPPRPTQPGGQMHGPGAKSDVRAIRRVFGSAPHLDGENRLSLSAKRPLDQDRAGPGRELDLCGPPYGPRDREAELQPLPGCRRNAGLGERAGEYAGVLSAEPRHGVRVPVFAVVPARQDVTARRYRDRVTVLVLF
ncbi:MAG: fimbria/pilus outer membrane usher protein [Vicinamibacterales bacterium]|nr:fimbria/pilus outer membrane usher protein [Vicinamibacterales bacterium]